MAETTVVLNPGVGGQPIATYVDGSSRQHQEVVIQTQSGVSDPVNISTANPIPTAITSGLVQASADNSVFAASIQPLLPIAFAVNDPATAVTNGNLGMARMTVNRQLRMVIEADSDGGATPDFLLQPATPAARGVKASKGKVFAIHATNISATPVYLKFFDLLTGSVTLGTTVCTFQLLIPGSTSGTGFVWDIPVGLQFNTGITYACTGGIANADNTAITATSVLVTLAWQ